MGILKSIGILLWRRTFGRKKHQESLKDGNKLKALIDNEIEEGFRLNTKGYAEFKVISDLAHKILWNIGADGLTEDTKDVASINKNSIPKIKSRLSKILKEFPKFKTELKREESLLMKAAKFKEDKEISINSKIAMTELYKILSEVSEIENQFRFDGHTDKHYHLICNDCKKIFDVDKSIVKKPNMPNFHIYDVMLKGLCKRCQKHYN